MASCDLFEDRLVFRIENMRILCIFIKNDDYSDNLLRCGVLLQTEVLIGGIV